MIALMAADGDVAGDAAHIVVLQAAMRPALGQAGVAAKQVGPQHWRLVEQAGHFGRAVRPMSVRRLGCGEMLIGHATVVSDCRVAITKSRDRTVGKLDQGIVVMR